MRKFQLPQALVVVFTKRIENEAAGWRGRVAFGPDGRFPTGSGLPPRDAFEDQVSLGSLWKFTIQRSEWLWILKSTITLNNYMSTRWCSGCLETLVLILKRPYYLQSALAHPTCHNLNVLTLVESLRAISRLDEVYFNDVYLPSGRSLCCLIARWNLELGTETEKRLLTPPRPW